jgi:hypothetical protein
MSLNLNTIPSNDEPSEFDLVVKVRYNKTIKVKSKIKAVSKLDFRSPLKECEKAKKLHTTDED